MKVLHLSEYGLPDWRIEKSAITAKREGHDVFFAGQKKNMVIPIKFLIKSMK